MFKAEGLLFIGDPHVSSRRPSRRTDRNFGDTVLNKIAAALEIANERHLIPVFLGDFFDRPVEEDEGLKTRLLRILKTCWCQPISVLGNHDIAHADLGDGDSVAYLAESGAIRLLDENGPAGIYELGGRKIAIGSTPHGKSIPHDVSGMFNEEHEGVIWLTHHDIAFESSYPGSLAPHEIQGCKLVINGHMHLTKKMVQAGSTAWINPGNITRMAIDAADHVPRVWELRGDGKITPHELPHEKAVFNFTGLLVDSISPGEYNPDHEQEDAEGEPTTWRSNFVDLLVAERPEDMDRSHDGALVRETIEKKFQSDVTEGPVRTLVMELLEEAVAELET